VFNRIATAALVLCVAACAAPRPAAPPAPSRPTAVLQTLPARGSYQIDSADSELRVLVYRAGPLAGLGHNHVMVNRAMTGLVQVGGDVSASSFSLNVPVDEFVVDDARARSEEGGDFSGDISEDARAGTRSNMLSAAVLNGLKYPSIVVKSVALAGTPAALSADLEVSVAGHSVRISTPLILQGDAHRMTATGSVQLRQTALGLAPYSLMHGALQVQDALLVKFKFVVAAN
jgi:hypothetical protein